MKIAIASDHGGYALKQDLSQWLTEEGHEVEDFGCHGLESCDYADFCEPAARAVAEGKCERGIVICTTGIGASITANKVKGIRCALCGEPWSAEMTRRHNNANVLGLGAADCNGVFDLRVRRRTPPAAHRQDRGGGKPLTAFPS